MSDLLQPINNRSQAPYLSESDAMAVEWLRLSWADAIREREERILAELAGLRLDNAALAERIEDLEAQNATLSAMIERMAGLSLHDRERLIVAEQAHTVWLAGLAVATLAAVVFAITVWR